MPTAIFMPYFVLLFQFVCNMTVDVKQVTNSLFLTFQFSSPHLKTRQSRTKKEKDDLRDGMLFIQVMTTAFYHGRKTAEWMYDRDI